MSDGLAAIALGNEVLNTHIYQAYLEGIPKMPDMAGCPMAYFDVHLQDEESDFRVFASVFDELIRSGRDIESAKKALIELLDRRVIFFNGLAHDIGLGKAPSEK